MSEDTEELFNVQMHNSWIGEMKNKQELGHQQLLSRREELARSWV
jgi:hypothetical protein